MYSTDKTLIDSYKPKISETTYTKYIVRITGLNHMLPVDFEPNYESNSKILYAVVGGYKFVTMDLTNMREGAIL